MFIARLFLPKASIQRYSTALLFGDTRKAYYCVLLELVAGPMFTQVEREALLGNMKICELRRQSVINDLANGDCLFDDCLSRKIWQRLSVSGSA